MLSFESDYNNGAHPAVLQRLVETNGETTGTYGFDSYSQHAREKIAACCMTDSADVHLLTGGTQTNAIVIDAMLRSYEAVLCPETAHINTHEAGAVEACGHKVIGLPHRNGCLDAETLEQWMLRFEQDESRDHVAQPGMVYISFPTELGTLYSLSQLEALYGVCRQHGLQLFVDGARMGYGLMAEGCDVTLPLLAKHCDAFYIGGTKVGTLCGEAVVFTHGNTPKSFFSCIKRHGALLAKGRLTGVQMDALFTDGLYLSIARHAIDMARRLREVLTAAGFPFAAQSPTNQQFVVLPNDVMQRLAQRVQFICWEPFDDRHTVCRFVTSWATTDDDIDQLADILTHL